MIELARGNLLEAEAEALVNTVNCIGHMGKGIALQFKQAFPANFKAYQAATSRPSAIGAASRALRTSLLGSKRWWPRCSGWAFAPLPCRRWAAAWAGWTGVWYAR